MKRKEESGELRKVVVRFRWRKNQKKIGKKKKWAGVPAGRLEKIGGEEEKMERMGCSPVCYWGRKRKKKNVEEEV